ncbi:MAG: PIN domain-containing protein [Chloroflexota bacterium]
MQVLILDVTLYELGNTCLRSLRWSAEQTAGQLDDLVRLCGVPLSPLPRWRRDAAELAETRGVTYYDASYAAAARGLGIALISADRQLLQAQLAESVTSFVKRLRLR